MSQQLLSGTFADIDGYSKIIQKLKKKTSGPGNPAYEVEQMMQRATRNAGIPDPRKVFEPDCGGCDVDYQVLDAAGAVAESVQMKIKNVSAVVNAIKYGQLQKAPGVVRAVEVKMRNYTPQRFAANRSAILARLADERKQAPWLQLLLTDQAGNVIPL